MYMACVTGSSRANNRSSASLCHCCDPEAPSPAPELFTPARHPVLLLRAQRARARARLLGLPLEVVATAGCVKRGQAPSTVMSPMWATLVFRSEGEQSVHFPYLRSCARSVDAISFSRRIPQATQTASGLPCTPGAAAHCTARFALDQPHSLVMRRCGDHCWIDPAIRWYVISREGHHRMCTPPTIG